MKKNLLIVMTLGGVALTGFLFQNFRFVPGISRSVELPLGLKPAALDMPDTEVLDPALIEVGNLLFFDQRLSRNNAISCATCHQPARGYAASGLMLGVDGTRMKNTSPPATNRAFASLNTWNGRRTLQQQSLAPILDAHEMGLSPDQLVAKVADIPGYQERFNRLLTEGIIPGPAISPNNVARALTTFQRSLMAANSRVDRYEAGEAIILSEAEIAGRKLFHGKANCVACHNGPNYTDEQFHNIVSGCSATDCDFPTTARTDNEAGRYHVTKNIADLGKFKTPSLRNVALRAPYFHSGLDPDLEFVVGAYNNSSDLQRVNGQSPILHNLAMTDLEESQLVAFLKALTGKIPKDPVLSLTGTATSSTQRENVLLSPDIFDVAFYKSRYSDISGMTDTDAKRHWINNGAREGRHGVIQFNVREYIKLNLPSSFSDTDYLPAIYHYLDRGRRQGLAGRYLLAKGFFNSVDYRTEYIRRRGQRFGDVDHEQAVIDYLKIGVDSYIKPHQAPKGYFSVNGLYYYANRNSYCRFTDANEFYVSLGRSDGRGFTRLPEIPFNTSTQNGGMCRVATRPPTTSIPQFGTEIKTGNRTFGGGQSTTFDAVCSAGRTVKRLRAACDMDEGTSSGYTMPSDRFNNVPWNELAVLETTPNGYCRVGNVIAKGNTS